MLMSTSSRVSGWVAATAMVAGVGMFAPSQVQASESSWGYLDLRLGVRTLPTERFSIQGDNAYRGEFDEAYRISLTLIGPLCNLVPIGCGYEPYPRRSNTPNRQRVGHEYDDLIELETIQWDSHQSSTGFDLLVGLEFSYNYLEHEGQWEGDVPGIPEVTVDTFAIIGHVGWALALMPSRVGVMHIELTGFGGLGFSELNWRDSDVSGRSDSTTGLYYEYGGRLGLLYTFRPGLQVGVEARLMEANHTNKLFGESTTLRISGPSLGADIGWRF